MADPILNIGSQQHNVGRGVSVLELGRQRQTIYPRHIQINCHDIDRERGGLLERLLPIAGFDNGPVWVHASDERADHHPRQARVINDENGWYGWHAASLILSSVIWSYDL